MKAHDFVWEAEYVCVHWTLLRGLSCNQSDTNLMNVAVGSSNHYQQASMLQCNQIPWQHVGCKVLTLSSSSLLLSSRVHLLYSEGEVWRKFIKKSNQRNKTDILLLLLVISSTSSLCVWLCLSCLCLSVVKVQWRLSFLLLLITAHNYLLFHDGIDSSSMCGRSVWVLKSLKYTYRNIRESPKSRFRHLESSLVVS